jgi:hypothetical protein
VTLSRQDDGIVYPRQRRRWTHPATAAALLAVGAAGCGTAVSSTSPSTSPSVGRAELPVQVASTSCSSAVTVAVSSGVATSAGRRADVSSCVFVLTDGRRFKCAGPAFARSMPTPSTLQHAKACTMMSPLAVPASLRAVVARIARDRTCLTSKGLRVTGGAVLPRQGPNSADGELITEGALIAFYTDQRKAGRLEPQVKQNAKRFDGQVVRNGAVTVLWIHPPGSGLRDAVSGCVFR